MNNNEPHLPFVLQIKENSAIIWQCWVFFFSYRRGLLVLVEKLWKFLPFFLFFFFFLALYTWLIVLYSEMGYTSSVSKGHRLFLLSSFFFPIPGNVMWHTHCIQWSTWESSPCESYCIQPSCTFPAIWKWVFRDTIFRKEVIFLHYKFQSFIIQ